MTDMSPPPKLLLGMWSLYPVLVPFYLMGKTPIPGTEKVEGGVPQLADYFLVLLMTLTVLRVPFRLTRSAVMLLSAMAAFVSYTIFVNFAWTVGLEDLSLLKSSLYYVYDGALLMTCLMLYTTFGDAFLDVTVHAVGASVVLQAALSPFATQSSASRQALFFNNENQLGYFSVLAGTIILLGARHVTIRAWHQALFFAALGYLALLSQSRSALLGLGALAILAHLDRPLRLMMVLGALAVASALLLVAPPLLSKSEERLVVGGEYDTFATRGYDRIVNYPEHVLFGAGEGAYERFRSELYASELHSSYGTLLFCYGIPGTALFTLVLWLFCRHDPWTALFVIPALVHGMGHQGLRFAFFWATLAFLYGCAVRAGAASNALAVPVGAVAPPDAEAAPL
jgi:hypothetical protein